MRVFFNYIFACTFCFSNIVSYCHLFLINRKTESKEWIVYVLALELAKEFNWHSLISRLQSHMSVVQVGFAAEFTDPATPKGVKQVGSLTPKF